MGSKKPSSEKKGQSKAHTLKVKKTAMKKPALPKVTKGQKVTIKMEMQKGKPKKKPSLPNLTKGQKVTNKREMLKGKPKKNPALPKVTIGKKVTIKREAQKGKPKKKPALPKVRKGKKKTTKIAKFKQNAKNSQGHVSFDKIISGGWVNDSLELGVLKRIKEKANLIVFEFELNAKKIDAWSSKTSQWGSKNKRLLKVGHRYVLQGTMLAQRRNATRDLYSTSNFNFKVCLSKIDIVLEKLQRSASSSRASDLVTLKHINEKIDSGTAFDDLKAKNVEILSGDVRRYMGCEDCFSGLSTPNKKGNYYCNLCNKKTKSKRKKERRVCIMIWNVELKDKHGNILKNALCFQRQCQALFGEGITKRLCKSSSDMDARNEFESMIGTRVDVTIKHQPPTKSSISFKKGFTGSKIIIEFLKVMEKIKNPKVKLPTSDSSLKITQEDSDRCLCEEEDDEDDDDDKVNPSSSAPINLSGNQNLPTQVPFYFDTTGQYELQETADGFIGLAIIINFTFVGAPKPRRGSDVDVKRLLDLFPQLGVRVFRGKALQDIDKERFLNEVDEFKKELVRGNYSSLFFVLMSHGSLFNVTLRGKKENRLNIYRDIKPLFREEGFENFNGKPKIFIFNSCQNFVPIEESVDVDETLKIPDVLECFPCEPGFRAKRSPKKGSYFIQTMANVFENFYETLHIEQMMKMVQERMGQLRLGSEKKSINIPEYKPKLFGKNFFFKRSLPIQYY